MMFSKRLHHFWRVMLGLVVVVSTIGSVFLPVSTASAAPRQAENISRGLVAVKVSSGVFISWRLLGTEQLSTSFNVYRNGTKVNAAPITNSTNLLDTAGTTSSTYTVRAVVGGVEQPASPPSACGQTTTWMS